MRKFLVAFGLVLLTSVFPTILVADDPITQTYLVGCYSNNPGPGATMDQTLFLINVGVGGTPLTSPVGDVCANVYVFDSNQEMIACCSCRLTPNELVTASVANELTNNPLVSVIPTAGVIKIMPTAAESDVCSPTAPSASSDGSLVAGFSTHLEVSGPATFITETNTPVAALSSAEAAFLTNACTFVQYLGRGYGRGTCRCTDSRNSDPVTYSISGTISGAGGSGAAVNLTGISTATVTADASGNYTFTGLQNGSYTVTPSKTGFTFTPASQPATVNNANVTAMNFSTVTYSLTSGNTYNGVYGGTFNGDVTISTDQNCTFVSGNITGNVQQNGGNLVLASSMVGGNVQINGGGTFSIGPSVVIDGDLQIQNIPAGTAQNQVCGATVKGNLQFHNNGTAVQIGSASPSSCAGNVIDGNLEVHNNTSSNAIFGNTISGNLEDHNNTGPAQVFNNTVTENLHCQNNSSITGGGNKAEQKQGQCAAF